uniref:Putative ovule protein n=1 Tax=Solanum chacoense TaxID=4108 RepID=A0A0V0I0S6_SOLCH
MGLVCWYSYKHNLLYLYNVTTKEIKPFSSSMNKDILSRQIFTKQPRLFLGFDGNYKLLHIFSNLLCRFNGKILTLEETNSSWRKIDVIDEINGSRAFNYFVECIFFNEVVYWYSWNDSVVYFDFRENLFLIQILNFFFFGIVFASKRISFNSNSKLLRRGKI